MNSKTGVMVGSLLGLNWSLVPYKCWSNIWSLLIKSGVERTKRAERQAFVVSQVVETINAIHLSNRILGINILFSQRWFNQPGTMVKLQQWHAVVNRVPMLACLFSPKHTGRLYFPVELNLAEPWDLLGPRTHEQKWHVLWAKALELPGCGATLFILLRFQCSRECYVPSLGFRQQQNHQLTPGGWPCSMKEKWPFVVLCQQCLWQWALSWIADLPCYSSSIHSRLLACLPLIPMILKSTFPLHHSWIKTFKI